MDALGIDLGTGAIRAAYLRGTQPELLQFPDGSRSIPAVVSVSRGTIRVGRPALSRAMTQPECTVRGVKRLLGRTIDDPIVSALRERLAFGIEESPDRTLSLRLGQDLHRPEALAAALLSHLLDIAEQGDGQRPTTGVLTCPYWYGPRQRKALTDAASSVGLRSLQVISEATATALSLTALENRQRVVGVVDAGAGGCTASVLEVGPHRVQLLSSAGDPVAGGEDVDHKMVRAAIKGLRKRHGDFEVQPAIYEMVRQICEAAKADLAQTSNLRIVIPFLPVGSGIHNQQMNLDRDSVELLLRDTVSRIGTACAQAMERAGLQRGQLEAVYATGGLARMLSVRSRITETMGDIASRMLDPDGSVALGAAFQAGMLSGVIEGIPIIDIHTAASLPPSRMGVTSLPPPAVVTIPPQPGRTMSSQLPRVSVPPTASQPPDAPRSPGRSDAPKRQSSTPPPGTALDPVGGPRSSAPPPGADRVRVDVQAFRVELAGLLAAMRAGAVTDAGGAARGRGYIVRGTEMQADDAVLDERELGRRVESLTELWRLLAMVMQTARQYRWDHPHAARQLAHAHQSVTEALASNPRAIRWEVGTLQFTYRGVPVWRPDRAPYNRVPYELFVDGVRAIQLQPGVTPDELRDLLGVMLRDAGLGFGADDNASTALWDRKLKHVAYLAVDSFAEGDDPEFQDQRDELASALMMGQDEAALGMYSAAHREAVANAVDVALDKDARSRLAEQIDPEAARWQERYANAFVEAWYGGNGRDELLEQLGLWAGTQVEAHAASTALDLLQSLTSAFEARFGETVGRDFRVSATAAMFPAERISAIIEDARELESPDEKVVVGIRTALGSVEDDAFFDQAVEFFDGVASDEVRKALLEYLCRCVRGHEDALGRMVAVAPSRHAQYVLESLRSAGTSASRGAATRGLQSQHLDVILATLTGLDEDQALEARPMLRELVGSKEAGLRRKVIEAAVQRPVKALEPLLLERVQASTYQELPVRERRLLLEALASTNRPEAEVTAMSLLDKQQLIGGSSLDETRAVAADFLGGSSSELVLATLQRAAKKRWFGSEVVRETAERSANRVAERLRSGGQP
ncbi:MAG TPA: Hsp70 family protein [Polyangiaceae bacterium]|nr:Hsp70 family protein [Polyangiaceae bacterium]